MLKRLALFIFAFTTVLHSAPVVTQERQVPQSQAEVQLSYAPIVKAVAPAVVNVYVTTVTEQAVSPFANDPFFRRFFGNNSPLFRTRPRESQSLGSGVIVASSGIVLTNSHVVSNATDIRIVSNDGREYDVDLVLDDPKTDLAVLKVRKADREFPAVTFGDSDALEVGDLVLAIGNPFGVGQTVTSGIVSGLARTGVQATDYGFFIQTDAAINPGNSGGALVDMNGRLVGINSSIFTRSGGSLGIGFAIPANMAKIVAEAGEAGTDLVRPWFGVALQDVTPDLADGLGIDPPRGALVTEVAEQSPAAAAGLRSGDVILGIDGFEIDDPRAFNFRLATKRVGGESEVSFIRGGAERTLMVALEAFPNDLYDQQVDISGNTRFAGITAQVMTPVLAEELGLPLDSEGIAIVEVAPNSPAAALGLQPNDVIISLNGQEMNDLDRFGRLASQRMQSWRIELRRGDQLISTTVRG